MISACVLIIGSNTGTLPLALDYPWRVGEQVCFVKDGPEYTVTKVSWNHYRPHNHDCYIELTVTGAADSDHLRSREVDAVQVAFNDFIKKWVEPGWHGHLLDSDQNDGERMRQRIRGLF